VHFDGITSFFGGGGASHCVSPIIYYISAVNTQQIQDQMYNPFVLRPDISHVPALRYVKEPSTSVNYDVLAKFFV